MAQDFEALIGLLEQARQLLITYSRASKSEDLAKLQQRLREGDSMAVVSVISEVTGGSGSLNDQYVSFTIGDATLADDEKLVNENLSSLICAIEAEARVVARANGIRLIR